MRLHDSSDWESALLNAAKQEVPSPDLDERMRAPLEVLVTPFASGSAAKVGTFARVTKLKWGFGFAGAGVALTLGLVRLQSAEPAARESLEPVSASSVIDRAGGDSTRPSTATDLVVQKASMSSAPDAEGTPPVGHPHQLRTTTGTGATAPRHSAKRTPPVDESSQLQQELLLLERARTLVKRGDSAQAREVLRSYRARFPQGQLRAEAEILGVQTQANQ